MHETDGDVSRQYVVNDKGLLVECKQSEKRAAIGQLIKEIFLPAGYPSSVTNDYLAFYSWQFVQGLANSITSMLSAQAILKGVGVGEATASSAAAALQLAMKDAVGKLTWIYFAWVAGSQLDCDAKKWRLIADFANDFGIFFELLAPILNLYIPFGFLALAIVGNIAKTIAGVAGGATRFTMVQHFAKRENVADISAKAGSQDVLCGLLGMLLGMIVAGFVGDNATLCWGTFLLFGALHLFANYQALLIIVFNTLNRTRAFLLFREFIRSSSVLSPNAVAQLEGIGLRKSIPSQLSALVLGARVPEIVSSNEEWRALSGLYAGERYVLAARDGRIVAGLHTTATPEDIMKCFFNAFLLANRLSEEQTAISVTKLVERASAETRASTQKLFPLLKQSGWNLTTAQYLGVTQTRISWALKTM